jgi:hypothetical protein
VVEGAAVLLRETVLSAVHRPTPAAEPQQPNSATAARTAVDLRSNRRGTSSKFLCFLYKQWEGRYDSLVKASLEQTVFVAGRAETPLTPVELLAGLAQLISHLKI